MLVTCKEWHLLFPNPYWVDFAQVNDEMPQDPLLVPLKQPYIMISRLGRSTVLSGMHYNISDILPYSDPSAGVPLHSHFNLEDSKLPTLGGECAEIIH